MALATCGVVLAWGFYHLKREAWWGAVMLVAFFSLSNLVTFTQMDMMTFYEKMGYPEVRVRPAYFPYTEPSLEIEVKWRGKWLELGGAGIFRPEVTEPLGIKHPVLAWGMGLERLAMLVLGLDDIRQLYISDLEWLRNQPLI